MASRTLPRLISRASAAASTSSGIDTGNAQLDEILDLLDKGFYTTISGTAFISAAAISVGVTLLIIFAFCLLRPHNNVVYAPRAKYGDSKHVPPPLSKSPLAWVKPVLYTKEPELVEKLGMDATVFLRVVRMCRDMISVLTLIGCAILIPVNLIACKQETGTLYFGSFQFLTALTPQYFYKSNLLWAYVTVAYLFDVVICVFLWWNYRAVLRLRRQYFDTAEYQQSLAARTLLIMEIPRALRTDEGLQQLAEETYRTADVPRAAIARNVKELPELVEEHTETVRHLEEVLAKYLKNPNNLPSKRPTCKAAKTDGGHRKGAKVDAIEYLSNRIKVLEARIKETRLSIDKRDPENYGFASYQQISDAHAVAYAARRKSPHHTVMRLAPKPHDIIWKNLRLTRRDRAWRNIVNNMWVAILTGLWVVPNIFSAVFIANLSNLGAVWPAFETQLEAHPIFWGIVQGLAAPAVQSLFYLLLPTIFRRLSIRAGDVTKTSRERHVLHKLFTFFVFNNLIIYSIFSAIWTYASTVAKYAEAGDNVWTALKDGDLFVDIMYSLINMSTFWLTWLLQRNLGAAIDLAQLVNLAWGSFSRRYLSPTPRQLIQLSAPQPFNYASYYNYFLFYIIVTLCYAPFQPLVLPVTALYFWLDSYMKKYLLMYVLITKTESGGKFWRVVFNRCVFSAIFGNLVFALVIAAQGSSWSQVIAIAPLPFIMIAFKLYCARAFDSKINFYTTSSNVERAAGKTKDTEKVGVRFGNPLFYKPLITPMVHAKAQHVLRDIYTGRTTDDDDNHTVSGYSDMYMNPMSQNRPGKAAASTNAPFEIVGENELDFEHFKNRADFRDEAGGDGELFGRSGDMIRRGSNTSGLTDLLSQGRPGTPDGFRPGSRSQSISSERTRINEGATYPAGYHVPQGSAVRDGSVDSYRSEDMSKMGLGPHAVDEARADLISGAARMGRSPPPGTHYRSASRGPMIPRHQAWTPGDPYVTEDLGTPQDETSYDYFRGRQG